MSNNLKCKTCKYFDAEHGWSGTDNGSCTRLGNNDQIVSDTWHKAFITFLEDNNPQYVHVGENFGCVFHERLNEE